MVADEGVLAKVEDTPRAVIVLPGLTRFVALQIPARRSRCRISPSTNLVVITDRVVPVHHRMLPARTAGRHADQVIASGPGAPSGDGAGGSSL